MSKTIITYNQIISAFKNFCDKHKQINSFYSGQTWNFQTQTNIYPSVIILPQPSNFEPGKIRLNFQIFIADILNQDNSNLDEIYSDTLQIASDLVSYFKEINEEETYFYIDDNYIGIEPFEESFDDILAGWLMNVVVEIPFFGSNCNLPIEK